MAWVFAIDDIDPPPPSNQLAVAVSVFQGFQRTHYFHGFTPNAYAPKLHLYTAQVNCKIELARLNLIGNATPRQPAIAVGDFVEILLVVVLGKIIGGTHGNLGCDICLANRR